MGRKIEIGYLKYLSDRKLISRRVIENRFLDSLGRYANIRVITINNKHIEEAFKRIARYNLDYLNVNSFNEPEIQFLLREKLGIDIPFILYIHTVLPWFINFTYLIPFLRNYDIIIAPSEYAKNLFLKLSSKFNVNVVPYCMDLNLIQRNLSSNLKNDKKIITFMGRLAEPKGLEALLESLPKIVPKINNVHLNVIGPLSGEGDKNSPKSIYVKKIQKLVKQRKLTNRVTFKGAQLGLNKYKILSESSIFVNPTLAKEETFGIVNIEALACGVPVITTDWAASREIVANDINGYLLKVRRDKKNKAYFDRNQLVSLIIKVLGDNNLNLRLKKNARISAEEYDFHIVMPHFVSLLKKRKAQTAITSRWDFFKGKTPIDFGNIFNNGFLFFLLLERIFRTLTFSMLYNRTINGYAGGSFSLTESSKRNALKKRRSNIAEKIKRDFHYFLTSQTAIGELKKRFPRPTHDL